MISCKKDLFEYLEADKVALGRKEKKPKPMDYVWKYEILLRKCEYYHNCKKGVMPKLWANVLKYRKNSLACKCGFTIPYNTIGKGLSIAHIGPIVISNKAKIGDYCRFQVGVNIGEDSRSSVAPIIGNNVYFGPGAKIFGGIRIGNGVAIGANAVVNKSFEENDISIAGIPARKINDKGVNGIISPFGTPI